MKNFFQRPKANNNRSTFLHDLAEELNLSNVDKIKKKKVLALYDKNHEKDFLAYRFELLWNWMQKNKQYTKEYVVDLDKMIDKLFLTNELNSYEQQYIKNIQATVFAKNRNLKQLIVDFSVNDSELVFYRYELDSLKFINANGMTRYLSEPSFYITTQRLIISRDINIISIYYKNLKHYQYSRNSFSFELSNGQKFYIISENNRAIFESLSRVLKREKIKIK